MNIIYTFGPSDRIVSNKEDTNFLDVWRGAFFWKTIFIKYNSKSFSWYFSKLHPVLDDLNLKFAIIYKYDFLTSQDKKKTVQSVGYNRLAISKNKINTIKLLKHFILEYLNKH